jgi:Lon protease-like protein
MEPRMDAVTTERELALFPLRAVLFPGGLLRLKVFEARYLDLIGSCLREHRPFGVVALVSGHEVQGTGGPGGAVNFESVGTIAQLIAADSDQPGILQVSCRGAQRFRVESRRQQPDGLWLAAVKLIADDESLAPVVAMSATVRALAKMHDSLKNQHESPFIEPLSFDDAAWVANRWCEILPISQAAKQKLMELPDPTVRLQLVDDYLRSKGVVT